MKKSTRNSGFTLIEMIAVVAIIAIMASMFMPQIDRITERAKSLDCMANLRSIGAAFNSYAAENDGTFPYIEPNAESPVYPPDTEFEPLPILERLEPYGLTKNTLKCPQDVRNSNYFEKRGSSYQWRPMLDGETITSPDIYGRRGARTVRLSRARICMDYEPVHFNRCNYLYADGHAVAQLKDP